MNIEIVEFYPLEWNEVKGLLTGTLRVKLPDLGIHILGIHVSKRKDFWYFNLPGRNGIHHETGEIVRYPFIAFDDREKQHALMEAIRQQGRAFIEKRLADNENPLVFPQKLHQEPKKVEQPAKVIDISSVPKEVAPIAKPKQKVWVDPPKRQEMFQGSFRKR